MSSHFRASATAVSLALTGAGPVGREGSAAAESASLSAVASPLQLAWNAHLAAVAGLVALVLLGGVLVVRNRLEAQASLSSEGETRHEEFMTDREKVRQLISENGGRMKQSKIVDRVDWSKAKVSRLLAELEDDEQITKLRLGRENLVCLPGHEPTASKSPEQPKNE